MCGLRPNCPGPIFLRGVLEFIAFFIVIVYALHRIMGFHERKRTLIQYVLIAAAGWCAEESCIRLYGLYAYSPVWRLMFFNVPVLVVLVWPAVIRSAWDLATQLAAEKVNQVPVIAAGIVWTDACLIEPVALNAGLWHWNRPGIFDVPLIGLFGWACFAYLCIQTLLIGNRKKVSGPFLAAAAAVLPVLGVHLALLGAWWALFRWTTIPLDPMMVAATAWGISLSLSIVVFRSDLAFRIEKATLLSRMPAAAFILGLAGRSAGTDLSLSIYAAAFLLPYLTLMAKQLKPTRGAMGKKRHHLRKIS